MKKLVRLLILLAIAAIALLLTCPNESSFEDYVHKRYSNKRSDAKGENVLEKLVDKGATTLVEMQVMATYVYENKYLVAWVEADANGEKRRFVGLAGQWIALP